MSEQYNQDITHLVTCTELTNFVRGNGRNFVKFSENNLMHIANRHDENGTDIKKFMHESDNKVYPLNITYID